MNHLKLVIPSELYEEQVMDFKAEMLKNKDEFAGCAGLEKVDDYKEWMNFEERLPKTYGDTYVPSEVFLAVRRIDDKLIGIVDYRHPLSDFLLAFGGNIGYSVRPSERRKGYAKEILQLTLIKCKESGENKVLITCDKENAASAKTIIGNGGVLENEVMDTVGLGKSGAIQRYWIMLNDTYKSIQSTKKSFEDSFEGGDFYNKQTQDEKHLELILDCLKLKAGMKILDLGSGTGYLAFPVAKMYADTEVVGLDIVEEALKENQRKADADGLQNLKFVNYDGMAFPFGDGEFDMVITRYALHHFPSVKDTFQEIFRVLKTDGKFFLADPAPNEDDTERFVDAYMQMKKDGHIKFYTKKEWQAIGESTGLRYVTGFETNIRFPKKKQTALEFDEIMNSYNEDVIKGYAVEIIGDEIWITERVNNLLFQKTEA